MNLRNTLLFQDMKAAVAGTQATHADPRSADEWIKNYLDEKNKRLNDLRQRLHSLLDYPQPVEHLKPPRKRDVNAGGPGSGCRGENCGRPSIDLATGTGWYKDGKFYPVEKGEGHLALATRLGWGKKSDWSPLDVSKRYPDAVRIDMYKKTGVVELEAFKKDSFKDVLAVLPKEITRVNMEWWEPEQKYEEMSKEDAIEMYAAFRPDKRPTWEQDILKVASGGKWAVVSPEDEVISTWNTKEEAENAAYPLWRGIAPSSTGATAGARIKKLLAADIFVDEEHGNKTRARYLKHPKPKAVRLADAMRRGDLRPSSHGGGAAGVGGVGGPSGGA